MIEKLKEITENLPQQFGDCYEINSSVLKILKELFGYSNLKLKQVKLLLDREIEDSDPEIGMTSEPYHVMIFDGEEYLDFSTVIPSDATIIDIEDHGQLGEQ